ncbi:MAG: exodeoxyribonuclease VII large subunit [Rhizobiaceae bacterium]
MDTDSKTGDGEEPRSNVAEFSVSEVSNLLKRMVEENFTHVRVRGEISGFRGAHSSGHCYFALKDDRARLEAVIWRGVASKLKHMPEEGMEVIATGKLTTYPGTSKYQIVIESLEPAGAGALMALLEQRKRKLEAEGLFSAERKQLLPYLPMVIGVVTSPTGAVIRDVLHRIADRFPLHVIVWPVRVQGETCGPEVANAIEGFNAIAPGGPIKRPDIIIVARGGGSIEDLWGFNDEVAVRAVANSGIPLISAVGHETDWTLIDLAADLRAPTPTGAAELAVPVKAELEAFVSALSARLRSGLTRRIDQARTQLRSAARGLGSSDRLLETPRQRLDAAGAKLRHGLEIATSRKRDAFLRVRSRLTWRGIQSGIERNIERVGSLQRRGTLAQTNRTVRFREKLDSRWERCGKAFISGAERSRTRLDNAWRLIGSLSHTKVLERGFALVRDAQGKPVVASADVQGGQAVTVQMRDGSFGATVTSAVPAASKQGQKPAAKPARNPGGSQGNLF